MTKLRDAGVFLLGVAAMTFVGFCIYVDYRDTHAKKSNSNEDWFEGDWPNYDEYLKDLEE